MRRTVDTTVLVLALAGLLLAPGCQGDESSTPDPVVAEGCNPLASDWDCLLPYPSDHWLVEDASLPSGRRVALTPQALPLTDALDPFDPSTMFPADGFSPFPIIVAAFPFAIDDDDLVFLTDDLTDSLGPASPTLVVDAETGEPLLHFAELDPREEDPAKRTLVIHPLERLRDGGRYVVAIRGLRQTTGEPVPAAAGFAWIRDGRASSGGAFADLQERYEREVFPVLESAGVAREDLLLAWDFTVATTEGMTADMLRVRELALAAYEAEAPAVTVAAEGVTDDPSEHVARRIEGTIEVPLFLESTEVGARLHRDGSGQVAQNGTAQADFLVIVPRSVAEGERPARLVQFGHGFFGDRTELDGEFAPVFADRAGVVFIAVDWWGMSKPDEAGVVGDMLEDLGAAFRFTDRVHQAMANQLAVPVVARTTLAELPEMRVSDELVYDPDAETTFFGISMGHILGGTYLALSPDIDRAALSVGGAGLGHMMFRAMPFGAFLMIIGLSVDDRLVQQKFAALGHFGLDRIDPATYAPFVFDSPLEGAPEDRMILVQDAVGDPAVPNLTTHAHARMLGLTLLEPAPREIAGLESAEGPLDLSALVEFDFGGEEPLPGTLGATPQEDSGIHTAQRLLPASMDLVDGFLRPGGVIESHCSDVCDPE